MSRSTFFGALRLALVALSVTSLVFPSVAAAKQGLDEAQANRTFEIRMAAADTPDQKLQILRDHAARRLAAQTGTAGQARLKARLGELTENNGVLGLYNVALERFLTDQPATGDKAQSAVDVAFARTIKKNGMSAAKKKMMMEYLATWKALPAETRNKVIAPELRNIDISKAVPDNLARLVTARTIADAYYKSLPATMPAAQKKAAVETLQFRNTTRRLSAAELSRLKQSHTVNKVDIDSQINPGIINQNVMDKMQGSQMQAPQMPAPQMQTMSAQSAPTSSPRPQMQVQRRDIETANRPVVTSQSDSRMQAARRVAEQNAEEEKSSSSRIDVIRRPQAGGMVAVENQSANATAAAALAKFAPPYVTHFQTPAPAGYAFPTRLVCAKGGSLVPDQDQYGKAFGKYHAKPEMGPDWKGPIDVPFGFKAYNVQGIVFRVYEQYFESYDDPAKGDLPDIPKFTVDQNGNVHQDGNVSGDIVVARYKLLHTILPSWGNDDNLCGRFPDTLALNKKYYVTAEFLSPDDQTRLYKSLGAPVQDPPKAGMQDTSSSDRVASANKFAIMKSLADIKITPVDQKPRQRESAYYPLIATPVESILTIENEKPYAGEAVVYHGQNISNKVCLAPVGADKCDPKLSFTANDVASGTINKNYRFTLPRDAMAGLYEMRVSRTTQAGYHQGAYIFISPFEYQARLLSVQVLRESGLTGDNDDVLVRWGATNGLVETKSVTQEIESIPEGAERCFKDGHVMTRGWTQIPLAYAGTFLAFEADWSESDEFKQVLADIQTFLDDVEEFLKELMDILEMIQETIETAQTLAQIIGLTSQTINAALATALQTLATIMSVVSTALNVIGIALAAIAVIILIASQIDGTGHDFVGAKALALSSKQLQLGTDNKKLRMVEKLHFYGAGSSWDVFIEVVRRQTPWEKAGNLAAPTPAKKLGNGSTCPWPKYEAN